MLRWKPRYRTYIEIKSMSFNVWLGFGFVLKLLPWFKTITSSPDATHAYVLHNYIAGEVVRVLGSV